MKIIVPLLVLGVVIYLVIMIIVNKSRDVILEKKKSEETENIEFIDDNTLTAYNCKNG